MRVGKNKGHTLKNIFQRVFLALETFTPQDWLKSIHLLIIRICSIYVMRYVIWYHLYNLKNVKNAHGVVLLLVKLPAWACHFSERHTPPRECVPMVHTFFKLHKWYQFAQSITFSVLLITYLQNRTVFDQIDFDEYLLCSFRPMCFQQFIWNNILNFR